MKNIEIDDQLYLYIVKNTQNIGESASTILRRLLSLEMTSEVVEQPSELCVGGSNNDDSVIDVTDDGSIATPPLVTKGAGYLFNYINKEELAMQRGAVGRFLFILAVLYRVHAKDFFMVSNIRGKGRLYFAENSADLEASGSSTKPKQIAGSPYWVITNTNTIRKKIMLTEVAKHLGYNQKDAEKIRELL